MPRISDSLQSILQPLGQDASILQRTSTEVSIPTSIFLAAPDPLTGTFTHHASATVGVTSGNSVLQPSIILDPSTQKPPQDELLPNTNVARDYMPSLSEVHVNGEAISCETAPTPGTNNSFYSRDPSNITQYYDPRCVAFLGQDASELLRTALWFLFPRHDMSSLAINVTGQSISGLIRTVDNLRLFPLYDHGQATLESVNAYAARVADTLSAFVRATANESVTGNGPSIGVAQITKTCTSVAWPWLALPAALTISSIVFLSATILHSRHHSRNPLWPGLLKSSPLGILLHGPSDDASFDHYAGPKDLVMIEHAADGVRSSLQRRHDG
ncbi:hypothetical protein BDZ85DRAFT_105049 [Elsinoe ampelina]|uniref:Uncharacterized protein n=1 Tax=Elsinoe ampelina TaxID=302913 RepID=A0A6A6FY06_9PEZI|nr:hypothetical protein BDZ85DRAFT_105049 [Elsinoe ampelina]